MTFLYLIITFIITIASTSTHAVGSHYSTFLLMKVGIFSFFDLILIITLVIMMCANNMSGLLKVRILFVIVGYTLIVLVIGIFAGRLNSFRVVGILGQEFRSLICWLILLVMTVFLTIQNDKFPKRVIIAFGCFLILRSGLEILFIESKLNLYFNFISDIGNLISCATYSVMMLAVASVYKRSQLFSFPLLVSIFFAFIVALGFRRTGILILIGGCFWLFMCIVISPKHINLKQKVIVGGVIIAFVSGLYTADIYFFDGIFINRLLSVFILENLAPNTSNYAHIQDIYDALTILRRNFIFGAGTATYIPFRFLRPDTLIPFHSPHLHTWVRLSIFGFIGYVALQFYSIIKALSFGKDYNINSENRACFVCCSFGLSAYLLFQVGLPPFYTDPKQSFLVATLLGIIIGLDYRNLPKLTDKRGKG